MFVGIEHRLRGDKFAETLDKESKRYKITTKDSRATKEGEGVGMQISGGVFAAVANRLTSAAPVDGGKGDSLEENEGRIAEEWVKCHDGLHVFSVFFHHRLKFSLPSGSKRPKRK